MSKAKEKLLAHLHDEVFCRLGVSPIHGIGVFAVRTIPKGVNPLASRLHYKEIKFSHAELKKLPRGVRKEIEIFCYYDKDAVFVPEIGMNSMNMAIYLNHSKEPNVRYRKNGQLRALKSIKVGEELSLDYDQSYGEKHTFK
jgi:SET domain-containing protein